jgi:6-pyruvoyltetrahydropterin/6-carboxytetrahydropterin synthase
MLTTAERYHDISCGHRVFGHESKCKHMHGHNYRVTFTCDARDLDHVGRVIDFSAIKERLCMWLEDTWDHKFLFWDKDPLAATLRTLDPNGIVLVPFNPTAENMAQYLLQVVGPQRLENTGVRLLRVKVEETRKCSAASEWTSRSDG